MKTLMMCVQKRLELHNKKALLKRKLTELRTQESEITDELQQINNTLDKLEKKYLKYVYEGVTGIVYLQVKLCDPSPSALTYRPCIKMALYKYSSFPFL